MGSALDGRPEVEHPQPNGIVRIKIDAGTGERIDPEEQGVFEYFKSENLPPLQRNTSTLPNGEQSPLPDDLL
jgi:penicillin-binding protein 1A